MNVLPVDSLVDALLQHHLKVATAESCTGGSIAVALTDKAGSSSWFDRGWVTYSADAKHHQLAVPKNVLTGNMVSAEVATAMARGALRLSNADIAISVTGVAGPTGDTLDTPLGCCWFGFSSKSALPKSNLAIECLAEFEKIMYFDADQSGYGCIAVRGQFQGNRVSVRNQATQFSLSVLLALITKHST